MKILHILKTAPDDNTKRILDILSEGEEMTLFNLYEEDADYENLIDL